MVRFSSIQLIGDEVQVAGPIEPTSATVRGIEFALAQTDAMVQGEGTISGTTGWSGQVANEGLKPGPAFAFGVATLLSADPRGMQTFTWFEQVEVTG